MARAKGRLRWVGVKADNAKAVAEQVWDSRSGKRFGAGVGRVADKCKGARGQEKSVMLVLLMGLGGKNDHGQPATEMQVAADTASG